MLRLTARSVIPRVGIIPRQIIGWRGYAKVRKDWQGQGEFVKRRKKDEPVTNGDLRQVNSSLKQEISGSKPVASKEPVVTQDGPLMASTPKLVSESIKSQNGSVYQSQQPPQPPQPPQSLQSNLDRSSRTRKYIKYAAIIAGVVVVLYASSDMARHVFICYERCAVVAVAVVRCFKLYKDTLGAVYPDEQSRQQALSKTHKKAAEITLKAIERNGGVYIKLGQHLSALTYLLPTEWTETMIPLQDKCPRSLMAEIEKMFEKDMGVSIDELFSEFDPNPVGVASLAQVHVARLRSNGEKVAVKVQHPLLEEFVPLDVYVTNCVFQLMEQFFPEYPLTWLGDEMQQLIYVELDFRKEAANAENTAEDFKGRERYTALRVPPVVLAHKRILIMEYIAGARLDDYDYLQKNNIDPAQVLACLSHIFNTMIFAPGVALHCDPHGGNLLIRSIPIKESKTGFNFEIVLYDHGLYRILPLRMKREYSHFWLAVLDNDVPAMKHWAQVFAGIDEDIKFQIFAAAITGRAPEVALLFDMTKLRLDDEITHIQLRLNHEQGVLEGLMEILSTMPRLVLLILKTNDLTRLLDEGLHNPLGPLRTFLILTKYCARTVYDETMCNLRDSYSWWSPFGNFKRLGTWCTYQMRCSQLYFYDLVLSVKNALKMG